MRETTLPRLYHLPGDVPSVAVVMGLAKQSAGRWAGGLVLAVGVEGPDAATWCWRHLARDKRVRLSWEVEWPAAGNDAAGPREEDRP